MFRKTIKYIPRLLFCGTVSATAFTVGVRNFLTVPKVEWPAYENPKNQAPAITLPKNGSIAYINHPNANYYIVGGVHFGNESGDQVKQVLDTLKPDAVMVELCAPRFQSVHTLMSATEMISLQQTQHFKETVYYFANRFKKIFPSWDETRRGANYIVTASKNLNLTNEEGDASWQAINNLNYFQALEMAKVIQYAFRPENKCLLFLGDRSFRETEWDFKQLSRVIPSSNDNDREFYESIMMLDENFKFTFYPFFSERFQNQYLQGLLLSTIMWFGTIEQRKQLYSNFNHRSWADKLNDLEIKFAHSDYQVYVHERNMFMVDYLLKIPRLVDKKESKPTIVAVVGLCHVSGMEKQLASDPN